jgi:hypothetical protein
MYNDCTVRSLSIGLGIFAVLRSSAMKIPSKFAFSGFSILSQELTQF